MCQIFQIYCGFHLELIKNQPVWTLLACDITGLWIVHLDLRVLHICPFFASFGAS